MSTAIYLKFFKLVQLVVISYFKIELSCDVLTRFTILTNIVYVPINQTSHEVFFDAVRAAIAN